jgi:hypothetical protein
LLFFSVYTEKNSNIRNYFNLAKRHGPKMKITDFWVSPTLIGLSGRADEGFLSFIFCEAKNKR